MAGEGCVRPTWVGPEWGFLGARTCLALALSGLAARADAQTSEDFVPGPLVRPRTHVAVIGDFGVDTPDEARVALLVERLQPQFVVTLGDNNYPLGSPTTIDANIGKYYSKWIGNYTGAYGSGSPQNRFFPCLGNHDWYDPGAAGYFAYFTLPGNERYYDFVRGPVHFYALDSDGSEPDGNTANSVQAQWLQARLATATEPFQVVYFHHPPFSSGPHGDEPLMQWPFGALGVDLVLSGHDHGYERIVRAGTPYVVNGIGGAPLYTFGPAVGGSALRFAREHGALVLDATDKVLSLELVTASGSVQDRFLLPATPVTPVSVTLSPAGAVWRYLDTGAAPVASWTQPGFDDSTWNSGPAQLGYGDGDEATVVSYGTDPAHKHVTTWFRRTFAVADPTLVTSPRVELLCDDGAVVYLNGVEVVRSNLPPAPTTESTLAPLAIAGADESVFTAWALPSGLLQAGTNTLAVEVHQVSVSSSDVSFDLRVGAESVGTRLVATGSTWRYRDSGIAPAPDWRETTYDDSTWSLGAAQLGYGDGDEATVVSAGPNPSQQHVATWFRHTFVLPGTPNFRTGVLRLLADDGAIVWLNGVEVFRRNVPRYGVDAQTTAAFALDAPEEAEFVETWIDAALLRPGANLIAVELRQDSVTSPDASFDLELLGR